MRPFSAILLQACSDDALIERLSGLLAQSRRVEVEVVAHIGEVDARRLFRREGAASMFAYCTDSLHLSEHEAYLRITVARAAREHPVLLDMLGSARLHLSGIAKLIPILTAANRDSVLRRACHKSKRAIEDLVAEVSPRADAPATIRRLSARTVVGDAPGPVRVELASQAAATVPLTPSTLPADAGEPRDDEARLGPDRVGALAASPLTTGPPSAGSLHAGPPHAGAPHAQGTQASIQALAPDRYKIQFTASRDFRDKLDKLRALMRTTVPDGDLARIFEQAVSEMLDRLEARRLGKIRNPRPLAAGAVVANASRHIPAAVRRAVHARDEGRCRFVSVNGQRCRARERLEFHHVHPWAHGGDRSVANIRLMCRAHNALLAEHDYGPKRMATFRRGQEAPETRTLEPP